MSKVVPYVEYVDRTFNNPRDIDRVIYRCTNNPEKVLSWCRKNFGERGDGWDFSGGYKTLDIIIWSSKLKVMYELWQK
jgi:sugar (pentulose or hexulose) kinase